MIPLSGWILERPNEKEGEGEREVKPLFVLGGQRDLFLHILFRFFPPFPLRPTLRMQVSLLEAVRCRQRRKTAYDVVSMHGQHVATCWPLLAGLVLAAIHVPGNTPQHFNSLAYTVDVRF